MKKSKFLLLVKLQLLSWFGINRLIHSKPASSAPGLALGWPVTPRSAAGRKTGLYSVLGIIGVIYFGGISYMYSEMIAQAMLLAGGPMTAVLSIMMAASCLLILITGLYSNGRILFAFKDYDLVMSMPVSPLTVAASRIAVIYIYELLFTAVLMVPAFAVYLRHAEVSALFYPVALICMLAVPLIPLIVSTALGALITAVGFRAKRFGTAVNTLITLAFIAVILFFSMSMNSDARYMADRVGSLGGWVASKYPPAAMFIKAVSELHVPSLLAFLVISAAAFLIFCLLISRGYRRICSRVTSPPVKGRRYREEDVKSQPLLLALYKREIGRYFSSTIYVTNTAVGLVLAILFCVILLFPSGVTEQILASLSDEGTREIMHTLTPLFVAMLVSMSCTTGSSISLEGRQIWVLKSLPVPAKYIFLAKLLVNLTLTVPTSLICSVLLSVALKIRGLRLVLTFLVPLAYALFSAALGLLVNLKLPKLEWQNEAQVVKQSAASMVSMFGSAALPVLVVVGTLALGKFALIFIAGTTLIPIAATVVIALYLSRRGESLFKAL